MKIVCFGDSLTRGISFVKGRLRILKNNYPAYLQELFSADSNNNNFVDAIVVNKGVFNDTSDLLLSRLEKDVIEEQPDYVVIGIGGNDCDFAWQEVAASPREEHEATVPLDRYIENLTSILTKVKNYGITPILTTMPPLDPIRYYETIVKLAGPEVSHWICKVGGIEHWHSMYNRSLNKLAEELNILKVDIRTTIKNAGDLIELISEDGIHLTEKGYRVVAAEIYRLFSVQPSY